LTEKEQKKQGEVSLWIKMRYPIHFQDLKWIPLQFAKENISLLEEFHPIFFDY